MAYATIPHTEDGQRLNLSSTLTLSPVLPELSYTPLDTAFEDLAGQSFDDEHATKKQASVADVLKSLTGSQRSTQSYDLVDEDDYEQSQITPRQPKRMSKMMADGMPSDPREDVPARTASISRHLPLHNPTPDLQALSGAYLKNVERLEDSAERLSLAESMEEELEKIKNEMRRTESNNRASRESFHNHYSSHSISNSIIGVNAVARSGGYSPGVFVTSPIGSVRSQRRASQRGQRTSRQSNLTGPLPEPELEGRPLESAMVHDPPAHAMQPRESSDIHRPVSSQDSQYDRPGTSQSNDTYRQAQNLFSDFDGTHFSPIIGDFSSRRISLSRPLLARDSKVFTEAQPNERMVYYPAPVPVMLNLPKRLSKHNWTQQEKRRTQVLNVMPQEYRKPAAWLASADDDAAYHEESPRRQSQLPPQLRASAFFDVAGSKTDVKLKHGSAVITLDSILDAAAHAPVSAFTDHPIAGDLGREFYEQEPGHKKKSSDIKAKRRSSLSNMLTRRMSSGTMDGNKRMSQNLDNEVQMSEDDPERAAERSLAPDADEFEDDEKRDNEGEREKEEEDEEEVEAPYQQGFLGAPTTLLAELQMRKAQQKLRNRNAANAGPAGMHSTLLELDAVAQLQQKSRKQKHVALAWEDPDVVEKANNDDEDIPLGVLFPEMDRKNHVNLNRPLGLMEKKELEENEPLSLRRARLRGEPHKPSIPPQQPPVQEDSAPTVHLAGVDDEDDEENEGETLAQRRKRMQEKNNNNPVNPADDIAGQLGLPAEQLGGTKTPEAAEQEETLGQRRKRLQAEAERNGAKLKQKTSMGDLLRANPAGNPNKDRQASAESKVSLLMNRKDTSMPLVDQIHALQPNLKPLPQAQTFERTREPPSYFPNRPLLQQHQQQQQYQPQMPGFSNGFPQIQAMQSMPNLNVMGMNAGMNNFGMQQQYPYSNPNVNESGMNLAMPGMTHMMGMNMTMNYNPMMMGGMQMPMNGYVPTPAYDAIGMGPPLDKQQRATIDRWRQGIA